MVLAFLKTVFTFVMVPIGLMLEFLVEFPFRLAVFLSADPKSPRHGRARRK